MTNADCTVYNRETDPLTRADRWRRTELRGVFWQEERCAADDGKGLSVGRGFSGGAVRSAGKGFSAGSAARVFIPFAAQGGFPYRPPRDWAGSPQDGWTLAPGDVLVRRKPGYIPGEDVPDPPGEEGRDPSGDGPGPGDGPGTLAAHGTAEGMAQPPGATPCSGPPAGVDGRLTVLGVAECCYGRPGLWHWEVTGR